MEHRDIAGSPGRTGAGSPAPGVKGGSPHPAVLKRKLTLLQLLDELAALKEDEAHLTAHLNTYEDKKERDHHFMEAEDYEDPSLKEGAEAFRRFDKNVNALDQGLQTFQTAARQLGSSVGLLASASQLRERMHKIQTILHENASELFPQIQSKVIETIDPPAIKKSKSGAKGGKGTSRQNTGATAVDEKDSKDTKDTKDMKEARGPGHVRTRSNSNGLFLRRPPVTAAPDPETLPSELHGLAMDVKHFLHHLEEFPEFVDDALNASIMTFENDLKYRADCLSEYEGQFKFPSVQRYVHAISIEMSEHLQTITIALRDFVDNGVPAIRFAQKHNGDNLLNLSTIATFFSAVTATTVQFSYQETSTALEKIVNLLFFGSLVLSISAAINSLLGLTWKRAMYRSPRHRVPWWVLIWIKRSPLVFMVVSVALFSAGLVCFCYSTQKGVTAAFVLVLTIFCTFGLAAVSLWVTAERWIYSKHHGLRWLSDVLHDQWYTFIQYRPIRAIRIAVRKVARTLKAVGSRFVCWGHGHDSDGSDIEDGLPFPGGLDRSPTPSPVTWRHGKVADEAEKRITDSPAPSNHPFGQGRSSEDVGSNLNLASPTRSFSFPPVHLLANLGVGKDQKEPKDNQSQAGHDDASVTAVPASTISTGNINLNGSIKETDTTKLQGVKRLRALAWKVAADQKASTPLSPTRGLTMARNTTLLSDLSHRQDTLESKRDSRHRRGGSDGSTGPGSGAGAGRLAQLRLALKKLQVTHTITDHQALVRHLQFSPNGKWLATCGWDGTARMFEVPSDPNEPVGRHRILASAAGFLGQVAWSTDGKWLLTKWTTGIQIWSEGGVRHKNIPRGKQVRSVCWFPKTEAFLSVEGNQVLEIGLTGDIREKHHLDRLELQDVAITSDEERMLGVATLVASKTGLQPTMSKAEKRVVVYNLNQKKIEHLVPVLDDVRDITISRNGSFALVSSENKAPPQLFRMDNVLGVMRLVPYRTYLPKTEVDFAGPSYFAGPHDEFILVPTKSGDILFWDRESGRLLHALRNKDVGDGDLTSVAWNYASRRHMLASASHDGSVRIWTSNIAFSNPNASDRERDSFGFKDRPKSRDRSRERENVTTPYMFETDGLLSASPLNSSRRPTATTESHGQNQTPHPQYTPYDQAPYGQPSTILSQYKDKEGTSYLPGRGSLEGSVDGRGSSTALDAFTRNRRVESPEPALPTDRSEENPFHAKGSQNGH